MTSACFVCWLVSYTKNSSEPCQATSDRGRTVSAQCADKFIAVHSYLPLCLLLLWTETLCSGLSGSRLWNQRWCKCWTPRLREAVQCRPPALAPPPDAAWMATHLERALMPKPAVLRAVGGAERDHRGGRLARFGWATLMLERCRSRMLPAIR